MNTNTSYLPCHIQSRHYLSPAVFDVQNLTLPISREAPHAIVYRGSCWNRLLRYINAAENTRSLRDARQSVKDHLWRQVRKLQMNMISVRPIASAFSYLHVHGAPHNTPFT